MKKAIFAGSFDPITLGHLNLIERATRLFDQLILVIAVNPSKQTLFSLQERQKMVKKAIQGLDHVSLEVIENQLLVHYAQQVGARYIIRGIRTVADFEYEQAMFAINQSQAQEIETLFLMADPTYRFVSSSVVKEIASYGGDLSEMVLPHIAQALKDKFK